MKIYILNREILYVIIACIFPITVRINHPELSFLMDLVRSVLALWIAMYVITYLEQCDSTFHEWCEKQFKL